MQRHILALLTLLLLGGAVAVGKYYPEQEALLAFCWRGGAILAVAWLAYEDVQRLPNWLLLASPVLLIILVRWSRLMLILIPLLIAWMIVRRLLWPDEPKPRG